MRSALFVVLALTACVAPPAPVPAPAPENPWRAIDEVFKSWDRDDSPGCALGIVRDGKLVYGAGYGMANLEHGIPNGPRTVFDIGSTSKQFTAACIGLLQQVGKLSVDDDLRKYVPEVPDYGQRITLDHLLHHTSGLRDYLTLFALAGIATEDLTGDSETLAMLARQKELNFDPGTEHLYSNSGYFLLSIVVKRVSGKTLAQFAQERIFEPLGMRDTHIHDDHTRIVRHRATGYGERGGGGFSIDMSDFEQTGDGAVMTTVEDLAKWDANFYEPKVGGQALLEFLRTRGTLADGKQLDYARGLSLGQRGGLAFESHGGAWAGYRAQLLRFPGERTSVICLCNLGNIDPGDLCWKVAAIELGDKLGQRPQAGPGAAHTAEPSPNPAPAPAQLDELVGSYSSAELDVHYAIARADGALTIGIPGRDTLPLEPSAADRFHVQGAGLRVERDTHGAVTGFLLDAGRVRNLRFARVN